MLTPENTSQTEDSAGQSQLNLRSFRLLLKNLVCQTTDKGSFFERKEEKNKYSQTNGHLSNKQFQTHSIYHFSGIFL